MFKKAIAAATTAATLVVSVTAPAVASGTKVAAKAWLRTDVLPVTQPVAVGGRFVAYTAAHGQLSITAFDPGTGQTVWSQPATFSGATIGVYKSVAHAGDLVYFYAPVGAVTGQLGQLTAFNVRTERAVWSSVGAHYYVDMPDVCRTRQPLLCLNDWNNGEPEALRVNGLIGGQLVNPAAGGRAIAQGLVDTERRPNEVLERVDTVTGRVLWRLPVSRLSPTVQVSTDDGWEWSLIDGVYVGTVGAAGAYSLARQQTFGVRASDGKVLWRHAGQYDCVAPSSTFEGLDWNPQYRCTGTATVRAGKAVGVNLTLQGFNVHTGRTTWTRPVGDAPTFIGGKPAVAAIGATSVAIPVVGKPRIGINLRTGASVAIPKASTLSKVIGWCSEQGNWHSNQPIYLNGTAFTAFPRNGLVRPCTGTGKTVAATTTINRSAAAISGQVLVWAAVDGLHAVKLT